MEKINPYDLKSVSKNIHRNGLKKVTALRGNNLNPYDTGNRQNPINKLETKQSKFN